MAACHLGEAGRQHRHDEPALEQERREDAERGAVIADLRQQPLPLLGERERQVPGQRTGLDRPRLRQAGAGSAARAAAEAGGQPGDGRRLEQRAQGDLETERLARPRHHPGGE